MPGYQRRYTRADAVRFDGRNIDQLRELAGQTIEVYNYGFVNTSPMVTVVGVSVPVGSWVIRTENGVVSVLTDAGFNEQYEPAAGTTHDATVTAPSIAAAADLRLP